jgi:glycosyltransferase involved in cell wall biosynthesis
MARIYLDARSITDEPCGIASYARDLIPAITALAPGHEFVLIRHASNREPLVSARSVAEAFVERRDETIDHFLFGRRTLDDVFARFGPPDLYHSLFHLLPLGVPSRAPGRPAVVITLHDLNWLDYPLQADSRIVGIGTWLYGHVALPRGIWVADAVIAISRTTAARAAAYDVGDRIVPILHGVGRRFFEPPPPLPARFGFLDEPERPYVVAVASGKPSKNLSLLVRAFAEVRSQGLPVRLVLIGRCHRLVRLIGRLGVASDTVLTGFVAAEELRALVGRAALMVHPARVEGFGAPPLEAMALGTPVAVSDIPVLHEVAGDAALRFDPADSKALAEILRRVVGDRALQRDLSARGRARAATFTWERTAAATLRVYEEVLARKR